MTGFREVVADIGGRNRVLTVYAEGARELVAAARSYFASQSVTVAEESTGDERVVLSDPDGTELVTVGLDALRDLTRGFERGVGDGASYTELLSHLDQTTFVSYDRRQMLQATREVEDRAWRLGDGSLYAGFQRLSKLRDQRRVYERLAGTDLDVHVYGQRDAAVSLPSSLTVHERESAAFLDTWFVLFDADEAGESAMLLAVEESDGFEGFWTFDDDLVADGLAALRAET
ncbi:DICT sensory domain-containing protein [Halobacterium jilantaiense]|uniref:DICT sensory domain-containing protein n=1 Tax=Halobacterium jilantaiense TaxID=355548 RepID=UPI001FE02CEE|nr:DICT sensory domain-containing protein [Halobacterium jilantaiense]